MIQLCSACNITPSLWRLNNDLRVIVDAVWSPHGEALALVEQINMGSYTIRYKLYVYDLESGQNHLLLETDSDISTEDWSSDGKSI